MFVIIKNLESGENILNVIFTKYESEVRDWIYEYVLADLNKMQLSNVGDNISYSLDINCHDDYTGQSNEYCRLYENEVFLHRGYFYNTRQVKTQTVYSIKYLEFPLEFENINDTNESESTVLHQNMENLVLNEMLQNLDREKLISTIKNIKDIVNRKIVIDRQEYNTTVCYILKKLDERTFNSIRRNLINYGNQNDGSNGKYCKTE